MKTWGDTKILKLHKTAFLCSQKCPAEIVLKSYDWAKEQRKEGNWVICGNHSQIEKDVFEILLKGKQPLILILARGMKTRWDSKILKAVNDNRLLVISPFEQKIKRVTRETAEKRNRKIIKISDKITIAYKSKSGQLEKLLKRIESSKLSLSPYIR